MLGSHVPGEEPFATREPGAANVYVVVDDPDALFARCTAAGAEVVRVAERIEEQMAVKSEAELALVRESVRWSNLAHRLLQRYTRPGVTETEVSQRASDEATFAMLDAIGEIYRAQSPFSSGAHAGYRGQIGRNSAIPHALAGNLVFEEGDVLDARSLTPEGHTTSPPARFTARANSTSSSTLARTAACPPAASYAARRTTRNCPPAAASAGRGERSIARSGRNVSHDHCSSGWTRRATTPSASCRG